MLSIWMEQMYQLNLSLQGMLTASAYELMQKYDLGRLNSFQAHIRLFVQIGGIFLQILGKE
jgi:hypothetical protein